MENNNKKKKISFSVKYLLLIFSISTVILSLIYGLDVRLNKSESKEIVIVMLSTGMIVLGFIISLFPIKILKQKFEMEKRIRKVSEDTSDRLIRKYRIRDNKSDRGNIKTSEFSLSKYLGPVVLLLMISLVPIWIFLNLSYLVMANYIIERSIDLNQIFVSILIEFFVLLTGYYFIKIVNYLWTEYIIFIMESEFEGWMDSIVGFLMELSKALKTKR